MTTADLDGALLVVGPDEHLGGIEHFPGGPDPDAWDEEGSGLLVRWHDGSRRGEVGPAGFVTLVGLRIAPNSKVLEGR
ncbi:hypothetical protein WN990_10470 [Kitasatospora purpeofusca]|uniref:hypothetical protein n=1 Tax=Kitasatospora purpeofusca TaxID=67352 RepID=UPI0030F19A4C